MNTLFKYKLWIGMTFGLVVIGLIAGAIRPGHVAVANPSAAPDVEVVQVEQKDVPIFGEWIGTLDGFTNADVRAQVTGYLMRQGYQEGAFVKKGQLLFEIDPRPFQAALDQAARAVGAGQSAGLPTPKRSKAELSLTSSATPRWPKNRPPASRISTMPFRITWRPRPPWRRPALKSRPSEAAVETAKINLDFTRLIAPIDGIAGQAQLQVGALVNLRSGPVTSVSTVDPIKVYFTVSEPQYLAWRKRFPTESHPSRGRQESAPRTDFGRRLNLCARGHLLLCRPPGQ